MQPCPACIDPTVHVCVSFLVHAATLSLSLYLLKETYAARPLRFPV